MPNCNLRRIFSTATCYLLLCLGSTTLPAQHEIPVGESFEVTELIEEAFPLYGMEDGDKFIDIAANRQQHVSLSNPCIGQDEHFRILPEDEVWLIDARALFDGGTDLEALKVSQFVDGELVLRSLFDLTIAHASGDSRATMLYVHGNQTDEEWAVFRGLQVYRNALTTQSELRAPVRFVIWAWKSESEKLRRYPDFQIKAERSMQVGETFAATLNQFDDHNLIVFGYSLGAQVLLSAFDSPSLICRVSDPSCYQAIFAAPAINAQFVANHSLRRNETPSIIERSVVFTNQKDRAIRAAQAIIRRQLPGEESTIEGLSSAGKIQIGQVSAVDLTDEAGRGHRVERYTRSDKLQRVVAEFVNRSAAKRKQSPLETHVIQH